MRSNRAFNAFKSIMLGLDEHRLLAHGIGGVIAGGTVGGIVGAARDDMSFWEGAGKGALIGSATYMAGYGVLKATGKYEAYSKWIGLDDAAERMRRATHW